MKTETISNYDLHVSLIVKKQFKIKAKIKNIKNMKTNIVFGGTIEGLFNDIVIGDIVHGVKIDKGTFV